MSEPVTFDDFVLKYHRIYSGDLENELIDIIVKMIEQHRDSCEPYSEEDDGPRFHTREDLLYNAADLPCWLDYPTEYRQLEGWNERLWDDYEAVTSMTAAGVSLADAEAAVFTVWCDDCGRDFWCDPGPMLPNEAWAKIAKPTDLLCAQCVRTRLSALQAVDVRDVKFPSGSRVYIAEPRVWREQP